MESIRDPGFFDAVNSRSSVRILGFYMVLSSGDNATDANLSYRSSLGNDPGTLDLETNSGRKVGENFWFATTKNLGVGFIIFLICFLWRNLERSHLVQ